MVSRMPSVTIIGGYGGMGRRFAEFFKKDGFDVTITGPNEDKGVPTAKELGLEYTSDNKKAAAEADLVFISVPIEKTPVVIEEVAPVMKESSCLMDLTSVKTEPCALMGALAPKGVEVLGIHPVFGPSISSFKGQNFVFCPVRGENWKSWLKRYFEDKGAKVTVSTPEEHDKVMSVVQGMTHFMLFSAGKAMRELDFNVVDSQKFSSPVYQLILDLVGRIHAQNPEMYYEIQKNNKNVADVRAAFINAAHGLDDLLKADDKTNFVNEVDESGDHFGNVRDSLARTDKLLRK